MRELENDYLSKIKGLTEKLETLTETNQDLKENLE
jgi:hypothetical protein